MSRLRGPQHTKWALSPLASTPVSFVTQQQLRYDGLLPLALSQNIVRHFGQPLLLRCSERSNRSYFLHREKVDRLDCAIYIEPHCLCASNDNSLRHLTYNDTFCAASEAAVREASHSELQLFLERHSWEAYQNVWVKKRSKHCLLYGSFLLVSVHQGVNMKWANLQEPQLMWGTFFCCRVGKQNVATQVMRGSQIRELGYNTEAPFYEP